MNLRTTSAKLPFVEGSGSGPKGAWAMVAFLCLLYTFSSVDRLILVLLIEPVSAALNVSDTQMSIVVGIGFAATYVLAGLPIAHLVDHGRRRWVLFLGVTIWSAGTISCAFVDSYGLLMMARTTVAIGEAALTPVAISVIAELFPREKRVLPTSIYVATGVLMGAGSLVLGGLALQLATTLVASWSMEAWRITFILVGAPGVLLSIACWYLVQDGRPSENSVEGSASVTQGVAYLRGDGRWMALFFCGVGFLSMMTLGLLAWLPTLLARAYGFAPANAGMILGLIGMPMSVLGTLFGPRLAGALIKRGRSQAILIAATLLMILAIIVLISGLLSRDASILLITVGVSVFALAGATVLPAVAIQLYSPSNVRARMMALNLLFLNLLGLGAGPVAIAAMAVLFSGPHALGSAISAVAIGVLVAASAAFALSAADFRRAQERNQTAAKIASS